MTDHDKMACQLPAPVLWGRGSVLGVAGMIAVVLSARAAGLEPTSLQRRGEFEIRVVDAETGQPIAANLFIRDARGRPVKAPRLPFWKDHFAFPGSVDAGHERMPVALVGHHRDHRAEQPLALLAGDRLPVAARPGRELARGEPLCLSPWRRGHGGKIADRRQACI